MQKEGFTLTNKNEDLTTGGFSINNQKVLLKMDFDLQEW